MARIPLIKSRDILLVPFPFSDQSGAKVRPVVVLSNAKFNDESDDVIVMGITSTFSRGPLTIELTNRELEEGNLRHVCYIKVENVLKLDKDLVIKKIGSITRATYAKTIILLNNLFEKP